MIMLSNFHTAAAQSAGGRSESLLESGAAQRLVEIPAANEIKLVSYNIRWRSGKELEQIIDHVWNYDFDGDARIVETYISYLRRKVDAEGAPIIHTVRGFGYSLRVARE